MRERTQIVVDASVGLRPFNRFWRGTGFSPAANGSFSYDWSLLDRAIDVMIEHRLKPFFELMGNPAGLFTDYEDMDQIKHWRDLVSATAERYASRAVSGFELELAPIRRAFAL